ncbi:MAG: 5'/3'-nucleotidase SurE [Thermocladium sp.]
MEANILITNDDGIYSPGLKILYNAVKPLGNPIIIAPETPKSSSGLGITLHKPLRIEEINVNGLRMWSTNGTPSDIIYLAQKVASKIDIAISGVNIGDNTSIQVILSSGTIGAAAQAALIGVPAIAFSAAVSTTGELEAASPLIEPLARTVINYVMRRGMPRGVDVLSINFPSTFSKSTVAKMAEAARFRYEQYLDERVDPRGGKYYWLYGEQRNPKPGTDVYVVNVEKNIAVTPLYLDLNANKCNTHDDLHDLIDAINTAIASWI